MSNQESPGGVSRRALLKSTALGSLALAAGGLTLPFTLRRAAAAVQQATGDTTRIVWGACSVNCGSRCALRLHVRDDEVVYVETDNTGDDRYGDDGEGQRTPQQCEGDGASTDQTRLGCRLRSVGTNDDVEQRCRGAGVATDHCPDLVESVDEVGGHPQHLAPGSN